MRSKNMIFLLLALFCSAVSLRAQNYLANNTVLIIRHAEKPAEGTGLTVRGEARAHLYAKYFLPFKEDGIAVPVDCLYAGADSKNSLRPRLTLEPLSKASGLTLHHEIGTKESEAFVAELRSSPHPLHPLVSWRHGEIPNLLSALGASPEKLLPKGRWPDDVYDWVIVLTMGSDGKIVSQKLIHEHLQVEVAP